MKLNEHTAIIHERLALVPYRAEHVPRYHEWMKSEELQLLTASEPLTLEEEYAMQKSWLEDEDKLTFILLARPTPTSPLRTDDMIGDVNLFLSLHTLSDDGEGDERDTEDGPGDREGEEEMRAECELMIAEPAYRGQGLGILALQLMLSYASRTLSPEAKGAPSHGKTAGSDSTTAAAPPLSFPPQQFFARVGMQNEKSIKLFERLGFVRGKYAPHFDELELKWPEEGPHEWPWRVDYDVQDFR